MLGRLVQYFFPDIKHNELRKFSYLAAMLFLIVGVYWLLRLLKYTIFLKVAFPECLGWIPHQGRLFQPIAKFWSPFVVLAMVLIYSKLIDIFKKHQLFYIICAFYATIFAFIAGGLFLKDMYGPEFIGCRMLAAIGWTSFFTIESFGSLATALFWSFTNSINDSESAKRGFPFIVAMAQLGAIAGSSLLFFTDSIGALWPIVFTAGIFIALVIPLVWYFVATVPEEQLIGYKAAHATETKKEGFFEGFFSGLTLLVSRPYMVGILIVSTFYEAISQIVEYQMQCQASISPAYATDLAYARFMGWYGVSINVLSFLIALLGTTYLLKSLGVRLSLLIYPIIVALTLAGLFGYFWFGGCSLLSSLLWPTFAAMVIIKGMGYAVNNPTKEMMYIPTSKDAKFKSKGWIDSFGSRGAKSGGAAVTNTFKHTLTELMIYGTIFSFGLIALWFVAALYVGAKNARLIKDNKIIE